MAIQKEQHSDLIGKELKKHFMIFLSVQSRKKTAGTPIKETRVIKTGSCQTTTFQNI